MKLFSLLLLLPLCVACGANDTQTQNADATDAAAHEADAKDEIATVFTPADKAVEAPNTFSGRVKGLGLNVVESVFVEGTVEMGTEAPVLVVVQSSVADICTHMQNGTYPKGETFFPMALIQADGKAVAAHRLYKPSNPDDESTDNYFTFAQLRHFDTSCSITPAAEDGMAILGQLVLDSYDKGEQVQGRFDFKMGDNRDAVQGAFNAKFCDAPGLYADYMNLLNPVIDSAHCL